MPCHSRAWQSPDVSTKSISELVSLRGRTAVVTGGARGIGRAIAARLAEAGAALLIADHRGDLAVQAAAELSAQHGVEAGGVEIDVRDADAVAGLAAATTFDIWVNNAGIYPSTAFLDIDHEEWDRVLDTNLRGMFMCCQAAGRRFVERGEGGVIVNIASTAAVKTGAGVGAHTSRPSMAWSVSLGRPRSSSARTVYACWRWRRA